jgi:hypothetical protein
MGQGSPKKIQLGETDLAQLELSYTKTTTNAELAIGNREIIELKNRLGTFTVEKGRLKICTHYELEADELSRFFKDQMQNFIKMQNKNAKKFITSGSDSGRSITINIPSKQFRKEVRCSERMALSATDKEHFEHIEHSLSNFNSDHIQARQQCLKVVFDAKLASEFLEVCQDPFSLSYKVGDKWKHAVIVMTGGDSGDVTVDQVYLPKGTIELRVGAFSVMNNNDEGKKFELPSAVTIGNENAAMFSYNENQLSITLA